MPNEILAAILSSVGTTSLLGVAGFFLKDWIVTRLTKSIQHEYDEELEGIKSELRRRETEIADVRKAAISNAMISQSALDARRLEAIDHLWQGFLDTQKNAVALTMLSTIKIDEVAKQIKDPKVKLFIDGITKPLNLDEPEKIFGEGTQKARAARPWVGNNIWVIYKAYNSLMMYPISVFMALKLGIEEPLKFIKRDKIIEDIKKALPDLTIDWENLHDATLPTIQEILETKLLQEIDIIISGEASDKEANRRALKISKQIEELNTQLQEDDKTS